MDVCEKIRRKTLARNVFDRSLDWVKTLIKKYQCEILNFVDLCSGLALCDRPEPEHESVMPLLSHSPLNVLTH